MSKHSVFLSIFLVSLAIQITINIARAEKSDNEQPLHIRAESQTYDGNKRIIVYNGPVHMEKGSLVIDASRLEIVESSNGDKIETLFGKPERLVTYRQKRDGGTDLWAEGEAEKIIYDDTSGLIKLMKNAKLILLDGKERTHESSGIYISYDSRNDLVSVNNTLQGVSIPGAGFTNAIIYSHNKLETKVYPSENKEKTAAQKETRTRVEGDNKENSRGSQ